MKRLLISATASLLLVLALVLPAAAADPGPGCSDFGAATKGLARAGGFGKLVSGVAHDGITLDGHTYAGVSQLVQGEHRGDLGYPCAKP
jgi:hypothetical protein